MPGADKIAPKVKPALSCQSAPRVEILLQISNTLLLGNISLTAPAPASVKRSRDASIPSFVQSWLLRSQSSNLSSLVPPDYSRPIVFLLSGHSGKWFSFALYSIWYGDFYSHLQPFPSSLHWQMGCVPG